MFKKDYEASWTDLDPNWHVANYAYNKYSTDARVSFFNSLELNKTKFDKLNIGPVLFYEHMYYYKEIKIGVKFSVTVEIDGYSEDGKFFKLFQNFYNQKGEHLAHLVLAFGIMDTVKRMLTLMPEDSFNLFKGLSRSKSFQILSKENMRIEGKSPLNI